MPSSAPVVNSCSLFATMVASSRCGMKSEVHNENGRLGSGTPFALTDRRTLAHVRRDRAGDDR
jgi:hypothetical protein